MAAQRQSNGRPFGAAQGMPDNDKQWFDLLPKALFSLPNTRTERASQQVVTIWTDPYLRSIRTHFRQLIVSPIGMDVVRHQ